MSSQSKDKQGPPPSLYLPLEEKLYRVRYEIDSDHAHIRVDPEVCGQCREKVCTFICPARVYTQDPEDSNLVQVHYENCLECGTCRVACTRGGVIWSYPNGGQGVKYRFG